LSDIDIRTVLFLARADLEDASGELKQLYQWKYEYVSTSAKGIVAAGASLVVALVAATLQHKGHATWWPIIAGYIGAAIVLFAGGIIYRRLPLLYREYAEAQDLLSEAKQIAPFLQLYRPSS
jgi:hypothetical protein